MVRVGIIGCGYWGPNLIRTFNELDESRVVRVSDLRPGRLEFVRSRYPHIETTDELNTILRDPAIDAVCICTPPATHRAIAIKALNAGKHLLVEKPLAMSDTDALEIVECAERNSRVLAVGHLFLYAPAVVEIRNLLRAGALGELHYISSTRANLGPPNTAVDVLWDLAPHDISLLLDFMGAYPERIHAEGASFSGRGFAETVLMSFRFPGNRMASVQVSWLTPNKTRMLQLVCSDKVVVYNDMEPVQKVQVYSAGIDNRVNAKPDEASSLSYGPGSIFVPALRPGEPLRAECADFVRCVAGGGEPVSSGRRALDVVRVLHSASQMICQQLKDRT